MGDKRSYLTKNFSQTQEIGKTFAGQLIGGDIILLFGDLGAGKTTFVQGLAKGLSITQRIISPTFIIVRKYEINYSSREFRLNRDESRSSKSNSSRQARTIDSFYHIDLYRTQTKEDLKGLGLGEILKEKDLPAGRQGAVIAIEWPEKLGEYLPKKRWEIRMKYVSENEREIEINKLT